MRHCAAASFLALALGASDAAAQDAVLSAGGPLLLGAAHPYEVSAPGHGGKPFAAAAALAVQPGIQTAAGWIGLAPDALLLLTAGGGLPGLTGALDAQGHAAFALPVPAQPALEGLAISTAFLVLDAGAPAGIAAISNTLTRRVRPAAPVYDFAAVDAALAGFSAGWTANDGLAFVFVQNGAVVHLSSFGDIAPDTRVPYASATKWFAAAAMATLLDSGQLSLESKLVAYVPSFGGQKATIDFRRAYSHTAGLLGEWPCVSSPTSTLQLCSISIGASPLAAVPGEAFLYGSVSMHAAGAAIETIVGQPYEAWFQAALAQPLGATTFAHDAFGPTLNPRVAAAGMGTVLDCAPLLVALLDGGAVNGTGVLSTRSVVRILTEQTDGAPVLSSPLPDALGYGLGCWVEALGPDGRPSRLSSPGAFGAYPWIDPERGYGAFVLMRRSLAEGKAVVEAIRPLLEALAAQG